MSGQANHRRHALLKHQHDATDIEYDNATSGLAADNVQDAIDEIGAGGGGGGGGYPPQLGYAGVL
jgi:hypothetical protein